MRTAALCLVLLLIPCLAFAAVYQVTNTNDSGPGSLRQAIGTANSSISPGPDRILFNASLKGEAIRPLTQLPTLTETGLVINGDIDDDGTPDVAIAGPEKGPMPMFCGLRVQATACTVRGLAICGFYEQLYLWRCQSCKVVGCYLGVTLGGRRWAPWNYTAHLCDSTGNTIGGTIAKDRNVIAVGQVGGLVLVTKDGRPATTNNVVAGNYVGLQPDGMGVLPGNGPDGIVIGEQRTADNTIGGTADGAGNVFGGMGHGITVYGATNTQILGNLFGLKADGDSLAPIGSVGIWVTSGATGTRIGGPTAGARNVFAGGGIWCCGVQVHGTGTEDTRIAGNYFGTNRDGTQQRRLTYGVWVWADAGATTIGGNTPEHGNYFTPSHPDYTSPPIEVDGITGPVTIRHNHLGVLPQGGIKAIGQAISAYDGHVYILDNEVVRAYTGVYLNGVQYASVQRNLFRNCDLAVWVKAGTCSLGNLGNANLNDDGGNEFRATNDAFIYNTADDDLKAEGNKFPTTVACEIDAKIYDKLDCPYSGRVDYDPLFGGVSPTGSTTSLALTAASAVPTSAGAEVTFSLSAPAHVTVTVLNLAGRPVATAARDRALNGGMQQLLWNRRADTGTVVPAGMYLVRITARSNDGSEAQALAPLSVP